MQIQLQRKQRASQVKISPPKPYYEYNSNINKLNKNKYDSSQKIEIYSPSTSKLRIRSPRRLNDSQTLNKLSNNYMKIVGSGNLS
jgi:hypothetical protein